MEHTINGNNISHDHSVALTGNIRLKIEEWSHTHNFASIISSNAADGSTVTSLVESKSINMATSTLFGLARGADVGSGPAYGMVKLSEVTYKPNSTLTHTFGISLDLEGGSTVKPLQIKVYYWIQVFTSYITQDLSGKLAVVVSGQSCNNTNTDINISELSTTLMQLISTKIIDYLLPQVQANATDIVELKLTTTLLFNNIDAHNTLIETIKAQIDSINIAILNINLQYSLLIAQLNNKLNALTINIAEPLNQFINIDLTPQYETGNVVNSNLNISLNTNIPTGIVKIIDNETYLMFDTKTCSAAVSLTSQYTESGE